MWPELLRFMKSSLGDSSEQLNWRIDAVRLLLISFWEKMLILGIKSYTFSLQVAAIYKDSSIGNLINIVIVKLVIIHDEQVRNSSKTNIPSCSRLLAGIYVCRSWNEIIEKYMLKILIQKGMRLTFSIMMEMKWQHRKSQKVINNLKS